MRILLAAFVSVTLLAACNTGGGGDSINDTPPAVKLYGVPQARITYEYSGGATGSKTHTIANYGAYQAQEDNMSYNFRGEKRDVHMLDIIADTIQYSIDLAKKTGTYRPFDTTRLGIMVRDFTAEEKENFQEAFIRRSGGTRVGQDTVLGKVCEVYELPMAGMRISFWKGITMRSRIVMGDQELLMTATAIDTDFEPALSMFKPPKDVKMSEPEVMSRFPEGHPPVDGSGEQQAPDMPADHPPVTGE